MRNWQIGLVCFVGALMTLGGVGGIEQSMDTEALVGSAFAATLGLALLYCGVSMLKIKSYEEAVKHNPTLR